MTNQYRSTAESKKIDMKLALQFKREYKRVMEEGGITAEEYKQVCELIEDLGKYDSQEFGEKLVEIFPDSPVKELIENE